MISNISPANKSHIDDMQHQYAMASINSKSQTANSVINITNANSPLKYSGSRLAPIRIWFLLLNSPRRIMNL